MAESEPRQFAAESAEIDEENPGGSVPQLGLLPAANRHPVSVSREDSLRNAETQMLLHDYSQLPVMTGTRTVHGMISWKSIGRAHVVGKPGPSVADCMDPDFCVLRADMPLLRAVGEIIRHETVLVVGPQKDVVGIVTTTDLSMQLRDLTDAFLLIGSIEAQIRRLLRNRFSAATLRSFVPVNSGRVVNAVDDLSFGEYLRVLQVPENWQRLSLKVDAAIVLKRLEEVRATRNAVMHFRAEAVRDSELEQLRQIEAFLRSLRQPAHG